MRRMHVRVILVTQDRHPDCVVIATVPVEFLSEPTLFSETRLFIRPYRALVFVDHTKPDLIEVQPVKTIERQELGHLGAIPIVPKLFSPDQDTQLGLSCRGVNVIQPGVPDWLLCLSVLDQKDRIGEVLGLLADLPRQLFNGHRALPCEHYMRDPIVVHPGRQDLRILRRKRPQVHSLSRTERPRICTISHGTSRIGCGARSIAASHGWRNTGSTGGPSRRAATPPRRIASAPRGKTSS